MSTAIWVGVIGLCGLGLVTAWLSPGNPAAIVLAAPLLLRVAVWSDSREES